MQTPSRRRDSTSGTTSAEASPDAVSGTLHFPAGLSSKTVRVLDRRLILLTEEGDWELLERCRALNPSVWKDFFLLGRRLYFEDRLANESRIHEAIVESIRQSAERHLVSRSGLSNARLVVGNVDLRPTGVPDVAIVSRQSMYTIDPVIVVEVAYTVSLSTTLDKVRQHFTSIPHLRAAIVVDIHHPWNRLPADAHGHAYYDVGNGKMVFFYFLRGQGHGEVMTLGRVVSFGNIAIDADDVARIVDLTGTCFDTAPQLHFRMSPRFISVSLISVGADPLDIVGPWRVGNMNPAMPSGCIPLPSQTTSYTMLRLSQERTWRW